MRGAGFSETAIVRVSFRASFLRAFFLRAWVLLCVRFLAFVGCVAAACWPGARPGARLVWLGARLVFRFVSALCWWGARRFFPASASSWGSRWALRSWDCPGDFRG